jgi:nucleoside 2-deoxyribosyltransferase
LTITKKYDIIILSKKKEVDTMIYLASPWFKNNERVMYVQILQKMRAQGLEVYAPIEHEVENAWELDNATWGRKVFQQDVDAIDKADEVWVLNFGMYSDSGTAWECGYAYAKGKTVRQLLYGFGDKEYSLMMINGCEETDFMSNYLYDRNDDFNISQK